MLFDLGFTLAQVKARTKRQVDVEANDRMAVYLTPGSALAVEYVRTEGDARRWLADDVAETLGADATYPFVMAERDAQIDAGDLDADMATAAAMIVTASDVYGAAAVIIKQQRRSAKIQIDAATTIAGARAAAIVIWAA